MKALKITLIMALLFASFTSCVKQDLNEDDLLEDNNEEDTEMPFTGGGVDN
ncbi:hypothetical protein [Algibacter sp. 2305UL17-15]|uniref:hypothetical protein n=1 Tax=Algibacter sp. 2305UL17-15 TaxID=3231268 RepID=UPI003457F40B